MRVRIGGGCDSSVRMLLGAGVLALSLLGAALPAGAACGAPFLITSVNIVEGSYAYAPHPDPANPRHHRRGLRCGGSQRPMTSNPQIASAMNCLQRLVRRWRLSAGISQNHKS